MKAAALLFLAACVQQRPEPVPDVAKKVALEAKRVDRLVWEVEKGWHRHSLVAGSGMESEDIELAHASHCRHDPMP